MRISPRTFQESSYEKSMPNDQNRLVSVTTITSSANITPQVRALTFPRNTCSTHTSILSENQRRHFLGGKTSRTRSPLKRVEW